MTAMPKAVRLAATKVGRFTSFVADWIFLKGRQEGVEASDRVQALSGEIFSLPDEPLLLAETDLAKAVAAFRQAYALEKRFINAQLTLDANRGGELNPLFRLQRTIFFAIKACVNIKSPLKKNIYEEKVLKREYLALRIVEDLQEAFKSACGSEAERVALVRSILEDAGVEASVKAVRPPIPKTAPELYADRLDRHETPPAFIRRVYAPWLGSGLERSHLQSLDLKLYNSLAKWISHHGEPTDLDLPTRKALNDRELKAMGVSVTNPSVTAREVPEMKERVRLLSAVKRRMDKNKLLHS